MVKLVIHKCKRLVVSFNHLPSLKKLLIHGCRQLVVSISNVFVIYELEVVGSERIMCSSPFDFKPLKSNSFKYFKPPIRVSKSKTYKDYEL